MVLRLESIHEARSWRIYLVGLLVLCKAKSVELLDGLVPCLAITSLSRKLWVLQLDKAYMGMFVARSGSKNQQRVQMQSSNN